MDPLHQQAHVSKSALDGRGREAAVHAVGGITGQRQPGAGPLLAFRGGHRLAGDRSDLPAGAGYKRAVAAARPDLVDRAASGLGSRNRVPALGHPATREPVQRAPAVDLLRGGFRTHSVANLDRSGDVTRARRPFPLVSTLVRRTAGRPRGS